MRRGSVATALLMALFGLAGCHAEREGSQPGVGRTAAHPTPSVLIVTLDTTRADRVGLYGYERGTTPHLDRLGQQALVFDDALSTSSWTLPAHASLFTGMFPTSHGAHNDPEGEFYLTDAIRAPESWRVYRASGLRTDVPTLAEVLSRHGYATGAVVAGPWMKAIFGLGRGFDFYDDREIDTANGRDGARVTDAALTWLDGQPGPFLLFLNYYDPHTPYRVRPRILQRFLPAGRIASPGHETAEEVRALYDSELAYADAQLGRLFDGLRARGLYDDLWIVVTADHGELHGEHGLTGHGSSLYQEEVHIPLVVKKPSWRAEVGRIAGPIQLTDLMAMLLLELGIEVPASVQGGPRPGGHAPVFAEVYPLPQLSDEGDYRMLREGPWKLLWNSLGHHRLYDLAQDPSEQHDRLAEEPDRAQVMLERLERFNANLPRPERDGTARTLDADTREALEKLGYIE